MGWDILVFCFVLLLAVEPTTESLGEDVVGQSGDVIIALLDDDKREDGDVGTNDAPTARVYG